jgi:hypothetical protein
MFSLNTYCYPFIMSIMSFLMHPWYLSCAYVCNRCTRRSDTAEFEEPSEEQQQPTPEVQEMQPSGEVPDEVAVECPDHRPCNFVKGKPRNIISLLISEIQLKCYCYMYCCIKFRCWMKTLTALVIQSLSRYWCPESYVAQARVVLSPA